MVEIAKILENLNPLSVKEDKNWLSKLDAKAFLALYDEWKASTNSSGPNTDGLRSRTDTFGKLRAMHQSAGYKNENTIFGSESEMDRIAEMVRKGRTAIHKNVQAQTEELSKEVDASTFIPEALSNARIEESVRA